MNTKIKEECKAFAKTEEDILTYAMFPQVAKKFLEENIKIKKLK